MRLLLPKPGRDWARWRRGLADTGVELCLVDPWEFEVFSESAVQRTVWMNLDLYHGVVCVSAVAARVLATALDGYWPMTPVGLRWVCNGPGTAAVLEAAGLDARFPTDSHTAEAVLALPGLNDLSDQKWLVVQGEGGRNFFTQALAERGAEVTSLDVYRRVLSSSGLDQLVKQSRTSDAILLSSLTLGEGILAHAEEHWRHWPGLWLLSSERVAQWAQRHGLKPVQLTGGAALASVRETLLTIRW